MLEATQSIAAGDVPWSSRDEAAAREKRFASLVERQSRFVFRVAYALLRNAHDAEDTVQETFLKIYRAGVWDSIENERAFLSRVAWRIGADKLRKVRHEPLDPERAGAAPNPEEAAQKSDWTATVHRLMDALPAELREPLALSTVEEMSSREIAAAMGIAEGTVRTRVMRARQILKHKLQALMEGRYGKR